MATSSRIRCRSNCAPWCPSGTWPSSSRRAPKKNPGGTTFGAHPIYLRFLSTDPANAAARLRALEPALPYRGARRRDHALFVVDANLKAMTHPVLDKHLTQLLRGLMTRTEAAHYSFHNQDIGSGNTYDPTRSSAPPWRKPPN